MSDEMNTEVVRLKDEIAMLEKAREQALRPLDDLSKQSGKKAAVASARIIKETNRLTDKIDTKRKRLDELQGRTPSPLRRRKGTPREQLKAWIKEWQIQQKSQHGVRIKTDIFEDEIETDWQPTREDIPKDLQTEWDLMMAENEEIEPKVNIFDPNCKYRMDIRSDGRRYVREKTKEEMAGSREQW